MKVMAMEKPKREGSMTFFFAENQCLFSWLTKLEYSTQYSTEYSVQYSTQYSVQYIYNAGMTTTIHFWTTVAILKFGSGRKKDVQIRISRTEK